MFILTVHTQYFEMDSGSDIFIQKFKWFRLRFLHFDPEH